MNRILLVLFLTLIGCGSDGNGGGPGGGDSTLFISAVPGEATVDASLLFYGLADVALIGGAGEATVLWSEPDDLTFEMMGQTIGNDLVPRGLRLSLSGPTTRRHIQPAGCRDTESGDLLAAWTDFFPAFTAGIFLDEGNILQIPTWPSTTTPSRANANTLGIQASPSAACLADGSRVIAWRHECRAIEVKGLVPTYFVPDECDDEPGRGAYVGFFGKDGNPIADAIQLDASFSGRPLVARTEPADFVAISGSHISIWRDRELFEGPHFIPGLTEEGSSMACAGRYCAVARSDRMILVDTTDPESWQTIRFEEGTGTSGDVRIFADDARVACDDNGVCIVAWSLFETELIAQRSLGAFARAFEVSTGRLGDRFTIEGPQKSEFGTLVAATGPGEFMLARAPRYDILMTRLQVQ